MKFISLFAGVGGFDLALENLGHQCVYANDIDKYCKVIYDKNFRKSLDGNQNRGSQNDTQADDGSRQGLESTEKQTINNSQGRNSQHSNGQSEQRAPYYDYRANGLDTRSITDVPTSEIPNHDLLVGGFPCQAFSIAGKRRGFDDTRGTLFFEVARILKDKKTQHFILENVKGLLSHDNGNTFKTIIATLAELGYSIEWQVLNSKNFGVPQNRERVFIVGHLGGETPRQIFPITESPRLHKESNTEGTQPSEISTAITTTYRKGVHNGGETYVVPTLRSSDHKRSDNQTIVGTFRTHKDGQGFRAMKSGLAPTIPARARQDGSGQPIIAKTVRSGGQGSPHGSKQNWDSYEMNGNIRRLTPLECERLQGFPDNWTEGVSDTQRYKQMGNAVTVNVVYEVAKRAFNNLENL